MALDQLYGLYGVKLHVESEAAATLGGITALSVNTGNSPINNTMSGEVQNRHVSRQSAEPGASITTVALQDWLDKIALGGKAITSGVNPGLVLYGQQHDDGSTRKTGANHRAWTIGKGIIVPRTLNANHQQDATLLYEAMAVYDGTNDPIADTDSETLPSGLVDNERFTIGTVTIGGVSIDSVRSIEVDFGHTVEAVGADSSVYPTIVSIRTIAPVIRFRGLDPVWLEAANIPLAGKAATHANTTIYLRKRADVVTDYVPDGTAQHIKITADGLAMVTQAFDADGNDVGETMLELTTRYDGTNNTIVFDTASTIT